jgi:D-beta-D-heptose 7-phosphate kinase/D-beta-D-heptose 1-phosphate adenosyltransferase
MNSARAREIVDNYQKKQVLVVGDVMLDKFVWGNINRLSPEAPSCPVLFSDREKIMLGGAANVASNIGTLGAKCVRLVGLVGYDEQGRNLEALLQKSAREEDSAIDNIIVKSPERVTTTKTRYVSQADDVHLLRCDQEDTTPISSRELDLLSYRIKRWSSIVSGIVVEDYGKGVVTPDLLRLISLLGRENNIPVFIDPKKNHWEHFRDAELVKPNEIEAYAALGLKPGSETIEYVGERLLKYTRAKAVIITRGKSGMNLFTKNGTITALPTTPVKTVDVSGAGDTAMSALSLARITGATWEEAMELANTASGIAVTKHGTSTVSKNELLSKYGEENA